MPHPELIEHAEGLEIRSPMRMGMRVLLCGLGLVPLLAPYELLVRIDWEHVMHPFFFLAAIISAGAMGVSALLFFSGAAGVSSKILFDGRTATVSHTSEAPFARRARRIQPLSAVRRVEVGVREWSDGGRTYYLGVTLVDGSAFETGSSGSRDEINRMRGRVERFLGTVGA